MNERFSSALALLPDYLGQHILLSAAAMGLALAIGFSLTLAARDRPGLRAPVLGFSALVQTIPGLALMALFYPLLLALSTVTSALFGKALPALGFLPALLALTLYALLPIIRNALTGIEGVDPDVRQAAVAVGMTRRQILWQVEVPLAAPVLMAGVRTAAVWTIGAATLATPVGQTSLGNYIFTGLQTEDWVAVLFGCGASATLALSADALLGLAESGLRLRQRKRVWIAGAALVAGLALALAPLFAKTSSRERVVIGAKNFSEQFILAELLSSRLAEAGFETVQRPGLGSAIIFRALASGDIDLYIDYSGTLWTNVLEQTQNLPRDEMIQELRGMLGKRFGVTLLGGLGFENAYALVTTQQVATRNALSTIEDVARTAKGLVLGADLEFLQRPEWRRLRDAYGLAFKATRSFAPTFMYRALQAGEADMIAAFSSDGRIAADQLVVLKDTKSAIPSYDAVILLSPRRARDEKLKAALQSLVGAIPVEAMRRANHAVDRDENKLSPRAAAAALDGEIRR